MPRARSPALRSQQRIPARQQDRPGFVVCLGELQGLLGALEAHGGILVGEAFQRPAAGTQL